MSGKLFLGAIILLALCACKKNRTCECSYIQTFTNFDSSGVVINNFESSTTNSKREYKNVKKGTVKILCNNFTNTQESTNPNGTKSVVVNETNCVIK